MDHLWQTVRQLEVLGFTLDSLEMTLTIPEYVVEY